MSHIPLPLALAALAAGAATAQLSGPLASDWRARAGAMKRRLLALTALPPRPAGRTLGALVLAATLTGGALAAYAAQPPSPSSDMAERLASQEAGVVGSGNRLSLRLLQDQQARTLKPGDPYADGWLVEAVTPTSVTLVKDGERRQVGLNPTGALAATAPAAPPSQVRVQMSDEQLLARAIAEGVWDGKTLRNGLTLEETRRYWVLWEKYMQAFGDYTRDIDARAQRAGLGRVRFRGTVDHSDMLYFLGPDAQEMADLLNGESRVKAAAGAQAFERYGPVQVKIDGPPLLDAAYRAQYPGALWSWSAGDTPGSGVMTIRPPGAFEAQLETVKPNAPNPVRIYYQPLGMADPNDTSRDVEGPEPPP